MTTVSHGVTWWQTSSEKHVPRGHGVTRRHMDMDMDMDMVADGVNVRHGHGHGHGLGMGMDRAVAWAVGVTWQTGHTNGFALCRHGVTQTDSRTWSHTDMESHDMESHGHGVTQTDSRTWSHTDME